MIGIIVALVVVGCGAKEAVEVEPIVALASTEGGQIPDVRSSVFGFADGPTELRHDDAIVGVAWGEAGKEWVYMFTNSTDHSGGWETDAKIRPHSKRLVPYNPNTAEGFEFHDVRAYVRFTDAGRFESCEANKCYANRADFESGFPNDIKNRVNPSGSPPGFTRVEGVKGPPEDFTLDKCTSASGGTSNAHVDVLKYYRTDAGWQYSWVAGNQTKVYAVVRKGIKDANNLRHQDAPFPDASKYDSFSTWCAYVDQQCPATSPCTARLVTWTYPPPPPL